MNSITYKETFKYIKNEQIWLGYNSPKQFIKPDGGLQKFGNIIWWTNIDLQKRHQPLLLCKSFNQQDYPVYDNYCAFNVNKVVDIPKDEYIEIEIPDEDYEFWKNTYGDDLEIISEGGGEK